MAILLATRDGDVAARCQRAVSAEHHLDVVPGVAEAAAKIRSDSPLVAIIDAEVLARPVDHQIAQILAAAASTRVIVMTAGFNEEEEIALLKAGVKGVCRRGIDPGSLQQVLGVASSGGVWVTRSLVPRLVAELRRYAQAARPAAQKKEDDKLKGLTQREKDIVNLIVAGSTNKQVGEALEISERTVKGHLSNIFQKLDVPDRLKLVLYVSGEEPESAPSGRRR